MNAFLGFVFFVFGWWALFEFLNTHENYILVAGIFSLYSAQAFRTEHLIKEATRNGETRR